MATNANMKQVSFYSTAVWKAIFDALTKTLNDRAETSFTLVTHGPRNFVRDSIGADGEIDSKKIFSNIGGFYECDPLLKDEIVRPFMNEKISFAAVERMDIREDGKPRVVCCFAVDSRDIERANAIVEKVNRAAEYENQLSPDNLMKYCSERQINLCGTDRVEKEIHDTMVLENKMSFPHSFVKNRDGSYDLRIPAQYEDAAKNAIKDAVILCSGATRENIITRNEEKTRNILDIMAKAADSGKAYIIVDADRPDHFVRTDSKGIHVIIQTPEGEREVASADRTDPRYQDKGYAFIVDYIRPVAIEASDKNLDSILKDIREKAREPKELSYEDKLEYYKRGFADFIRDTLERGNIHGDQEQAVSGRLLDNQYSFNAAIDHAVITKQDELAGDLKSDLGLNMRAIGKEVPESAIDLSDLNGGETFEQVFCRQLLGPEGYTDLDERRSAEDAVLNNVRFKELMKEPPEIQEGVLREIRQTYQEVISMDYEFTDITRAEYSRELEERVHEATEIHMEYTERE